MIETDYEKFCSSTNDKKYIILLDLHPKNYLEFDVQNFDDYKKIRERDYSQAKQYIDGVLYRDFSK